MKRRCMCTHVECTVAVSSFFRLPSAWRLSHACAIQSLTPFCLLVVDVCSRQPFEERSIRQPQMGPPPPARDASPYYNDGIGKSDGNRPFDRM